VGLRPFAYWECGFKSSQGYGYLSILGVVCFQVEVSATGRSFVQGSPLDCGIFDECDREAPIMRKSQPTRGLLSREQRLLYEIHEYILRGICIVFDPKRNFVPDTR